jgi:GDP-D-mannose dehydratase
VTERPAGGRSRAPITGVRGQDGSLRARLGEHGYTVFGIARTGSERPRVDGIDVSMLEADILDEVSLLHVLETCRSLRVGEMTATSQQNARRCCMLWPRSAAR